MSEHEDAYELMEPFGIDNGELDGLRPKDIFTLGVEWEMCRHELDTGRAISRPIHVENLERFSAMCVRRGREFIASLPVDGWHHVTVEAM